MSERFSSTTTTSRGTARLLNLSDGVFAIAITFLALDLGDISHAKADHVSAWEFIEENLDSYLVYAFSFIIVGLLWIAHHLLFRYVKERSGPIIWLNLLCLALVAALPYPSAVLGEAIGKGLPEVLMLAPLTAIALIMWLMWEIARKNNLSINAADPATTAYLRSTLAAAPIVLAIATGCALFGWLAEIHILTFGAFIVWAMLNIIVRPLIRRKWPVPAEVSVPADQLNAQYRGRTTKEQDEATERSVLKRLRNGSDVDRLCVFTDAVVAIAVTILALQLKPPEASGDLTTDEIWQNFIHAPWWSYFLTFALVSVFWVAHMQLFERVRVSNGVILFLNVLFLMFVAFLPIPTELLTSTTEGVSALVFYFVINLGASVCMAAMGIYSRSQGGILTGVSLTKSQRIRADVLSISSSVGFLVTIALILITGIPYFAYLLLIFLFVREPLVEKLMQAEDAN